MSTWNSTSRAASHGVEQDKLALSLTLIILSGPPAGKTTQETYCRYAVRRTTTTTLEVGLTTKVTNDLR